jgi:hypothetical protein
MLIWLVQMIAKPIILSLLVATLVAASGAVSSFHFAGGQEQAAAQEAEITLNGEAQPGSEIDVGGGGGGGSDFGANSDVSIYFMSAAQADMTSGSAFILQEVSVQMKVRPPLSQREVVTFSATP